MNDSVQVSSLSQHVRKQPVTKIELKKLRELLTAKRVRMSGSVDTLRQEALGKKPGASSNVPVHMADIGTENYDREVNLGLMQNEATQLRDVEDAIVRIDNGSYGICETCEKKILKPRLKALPFVRNCISCQRESEQY